MYKIIVICIFLLQNAFCFTNMLFRFNYINKRKFTINMINNYEWKKNWYPIALEDRTDKTKPFEFTLLGNNLVIWWDKYAQKWSATDNKCSHRLAKLSEGRINENGKIECPYHGWCFNSTGNCVKIQQKDDPYLNNKRFNINSYNIVPKQGIIWVWPENIDFKPSTDLIPTCQPIDNGIITDDFSLDLPYDYSLLLENIIDISHVPFTHHGSQGNRELAKPMKYNISEKLTKEGFKLTNQRDLTGHTIFKGPCYQHTYLELKTINPFNIFKSNQKNRDKNKETFIKAWVVAYAIPKSPGHSRIIARFPMETPNNLFTKFLLFSKPSFIRHMGRNEVLEEDTIFLHHQEKQLLIKNKNYYNYNDSLKYYKLGSEADLPVVLWRKWLKKVGPIPWGNDKIVKYFNRNRQLIDRQEFHLKHCIICQKAYNKLEKIKKIIVYIKPLIFILIWPLLSYYNPTKIYLNRIISFSLLMSTSIIWFICNQLQLNMKKGKYPPKRNLII